MKASINYIFSILLWTALALFSLQASAQGKKSEPSSVAIRFFVVDGMGEPISKADVLIGEGQSRYVTDELGAVSLTCQTKDNVKVSKDGYSSVNIRASVLVDSGSVVLVPDVLYAGENDDLCLPFASQKKRYSVGSTVTINSEQLAKYTSADIRNAITGVLPGVEVKENFGQVGVSPLEHIGRYGSASAISVTSRGRQVVYMVDDIPVQIDEVPLDPEQIESITIVRDGLEKTMYGPTAADGIIYIKTKKGAYNDRYLNVNVESGVNVTDRMAKFVDASQYAQLNNVARNNSGLPMLYSAEDVAAYGASDAYDKRHPSVNFADMMLKNTMSFNRAGVSSGGGNDIVKYYAYLGYTGQDDIYKMGADSRYDNVSINGNLDIKLHKYISASFGMISSIGIRKSNNYGYNSSYSSEDESANTTLGVTELPEILSDITTIPGNAFPIYADNSPELESPYYAVTSKFTQNPIANILENGSYSETIRNALLNVKLNMNLEFITRGLASTTYAAYGSSNVVRLGQAEDYAAYILTEGLDEEGQPSLIPMQSSSHTVKAMSNKSRLLDYYSNRFFFVEKLDYSRTFGQHDVKLSADYMITKRNQKFITEHRREIDFGLNGSYAYAGKYLAQFSLNEHGTYSLLDIWSFSPSFGIGWIVSEEDFLKNSAWVDFLKLRVQVSSLGYDSLTSANRDVDNYKWDNSGAKFGPHTNNQWFGSSTSSAINRTYASMLGNPALGLEKRKEISGGVDLTAAGKRLNLSVTGYAFRQDGIQTEMANAIPLVSGISTGSFYMNYNSNLRRGVEFSADWNDHVGDFSYSIGGWIAYQTSTVLKADELDYAEEYRSKVGKSSNAIWGLKYLGQFTSDEETTKVPQLFDESLKAGDFKYQDMNGDGYIDDSDACVIGDTTPRLVGAVNLGLKWKDFDLAMSGTFRAFYDLQLTNSYYWNGWGDNNYSYYTLNNVNNPSAPRLTYNKVNNNYKLSSFWLADGSFFKVQAVELGYSIPVKALHWDKSVRGLRIYVRGNNLLTVSCIKDLDPEALSAGLTNYPLMKTFVGGLKMTF